MNRTIGFVVLALGLLSMITGCANRSFNVLVGTDGEYVQQQKAKGTPWSWRVDMRGVNDPDALKNPEEVKSHFDAPINTLKGWVVLERTSDREPTDNASVVMVKKDAQVWDDTWGKPKYLLILALTGEKQYVRRVLNMSSGNWDAFEDKIRLTVTGSDIRLDTPSKK